jgi:hypothetical protein
MLSMRNIIPAFITFLGIAVFLPGPRLDRVAEERLGIAGHLVQALREVGYSCELADDGPARAVKRLD